MLGECQAWKTSFVGLVGRTRQILLIGFLSLEPEEGELKFRLAVSQGGYLFG